MSQTSATLARGEPRVNVPTIGVIPHALGDRRVEAIVTGFPGLEVMAEALTSELSARLSGFDLTKDRVHEALSLVVEFRVLQVRKEKLPLGLRPEELVYPSALLPLVTAVGKVLIDDGIITITPQLPCLKDAKARATWELNVPQRYEDLRTIVRSGRHPDVGLELAHGLPKSRYGSVDFYAFTVDQMTLLSDSPNRDAVMAVLRSALELRLSEWLWAAPIYSYGSATVVQRNLERLVVSTFRGGVCLASL